MWQPRRLTALWASTAYDRDSFYYLYLLNEYHDSVLEVQAPNIGPRIFRRRILCSSSVLPRKFRKNRPTSDQTANTISHILCNLLLLNHLVTRYYRAWGSEINTSHWNCNSKLHNRTQLFGILPSSYVLGIKWRHKYYIKTAVLFVLL
jgi:hypothetical protein